MLLGKTIEEYAVEMESRGLPDYMVPAVYNYLENRKMPGGFLSAVIQNDLHGAISQADDQNRMAIRAWVKLLYNEFPGNAWGSTAKFNQWLEGGSE